MNINIVKKPVILHSFPPTLLLYNWNNKNKKISVKCKGFKFFNALIFSSVCNEISKISDMRRNAMLVVLLLYSHGFVCFHS